MNPESTINRIVATLDWTAAVLHDYEFRGLTPRDFDRAASAIEYAARLAGLTLAERIDFRAQQSVNFDDPYIALDETGRQVRRLVENALIDVEDRTLRAALLNALSLFQQQQQQQQGQQSDWSGQRPSQWQQSEQARQRQEADWDRQNVDRQQAQVGYWDSLRAKALPGEGVFHQRVDSPVDDAPSVEVDGGVEYRVWFGTNRKPLNPTNPGEGFSGERSDRVTHYGRCSVFVPESHKLGSLGSSWIKNVARRLLGKQDDTLRVRERRALERDAFWKALARQIKGVDAAKRHALVFIHGYNVSFDDAARRAAQIGADLGIEGAMAFFSWPSKGNTEDYLADGNTIDASEGAITDFLVDVATKSGAEAVHVIAHSMGNRGVLRAVNRIAAEAEARSDVRFGHFVLAAADVDADVFRDLAVAYGKVARRTTLYVSSRDKALSASGRIAQYARAGMWPPVQVLPGIDTIDATGIDGSLLGHGYVAEARPMLTDIHELIFADKEPAQRFGLRRRQTDTGGVYWAFDA